MPRAGTSSPSGDLLGRYINSGSAAPPIKFSLPCFSPAAHFSSDRVIPWNANASQVAQVLLTLPYSFSQLGLVSGVILQLFYDDGNALRLAAPPPVQWFEVLDGLLGPYWKAIGLAFNWFLLFGSVIQLIACARIWSFLGLDMTTYTAWYLTIAAVIHGQESCSLQSRYAARAGKARRGDLGQIVPRDTAQATGRAEVASGRSSRGTRLRRVGRVEVALGRSCRGTQLRWAGRAEVASSRSRSSSCLVRQSVMRRSANMGSKEHLRLRGGSRNNPSCGVAGSRESKSRRLCLDIRSACSLAALSSLIYGGATFGLPDAMYSVGLVLMGCRPLPRIRRVAAGRILPINSA
ncbi:hypothetical protein C4D60_Mb05t30620 [Musa balbisiana]|uniref:Amino acid transporter transmembrane domain-containing protein n=1 Tax=Musa balbisiana TaxID=52838 RepID=A0A4S8K039_MUSBA|nr:hypothetical protein C4D60_Mb05t30620 [Musa balbisiana]